MTNYSEEQVISGWGAVGEEPKEEKQEREIDFLKLDFGDTQVRILDPLPHMYQEWYVPKANDGKGSSIPHRGNGDLLKAENDAFMKKIFDEADAKKLKDQKRKDFLRDEGYRKQPWGKPKSKGIIHVLDRASGEVKILDAGVSVFNAIKKYAGNKKYGDPRNYDITITKEDTKGKGNWFDIEYTVMPDPIKEPITEQELAEYEAKKVDLVEMKSKPDITPEQLYKIAKGATWAEATGNGSDSAEDSKEKSNTDQLPPEDDKQEEKQEKKEDTKKEEPVDKGEPLSEEELAGISFD